MTIKEIREKAGLSRAAFSRKYNIPVRTLEDWESEKRKCPEYLIELLDRAVTEDVVTNFECYDPKILTEIGRLYRKLLLVLNKQGKNPYPLADAFPTKYFIMIFHSALHVGIPKSLDNEIAHLFDAIDVEDWARSMTMPCPMELRQYFVLALTGYTGDYTGD